MAQSDLHLLDDELASILSDARRIIRETPIFFMQSIQEVANRPPLLFPS